MGKHFHLISLRIARIAGCSHDITSDPNALNSFFCVVSQFKFRGNAVSGLGKLTTPLGNLVSDIWNNISGPLFVVSLDIMRLD